MGIKDKVTSAAMNKAMDYITKDPEKNFPTLLKWIDSVSGGDDATFKAQSNVYHEIFENPDSMWYKYIMDLYKDIDNDVLKAVFKNFMMNATVLGHPKQQEYAEKHGHNVPFAILMDPTSACNLECIGCWAAEYGDKLNLTLEEMDSVVRQGKELDVYFYLFSGGEPLVRKADIIKLCEMHPDVQFAAFTNGTLIDEAFADEMLRVKNFIPAISVEGFEDATDFRRGEGVYAQVEKAMKILKEKRLPFGISCCYTSKNVDIIGSEEYFDWMVDNGAKFCWFFTYMPVGNHAVPELMVSAEQRAFMYERIREFRETKPIFTLDFWNDGEYIDGCIAGGRRYLHINANGDIEPCAFVHYSDSNIREKTLLEALQSPLFMAYREGQPFNDNHLRPCPLLDNPDELVEIVEVSKAASTDLEDPEDVKHLTDKTRSAAKAWGETADKIWEDKNINP